jgi:hypothetical protein
MIQISPETHLLLKKIKQKVSKQNPLYKINHNIVIKEALSRIEKSEDYEIRDN